ncbi:serine protease [Nitrospinaceae bacterium]|nr:serine protease [Nitrospinaceae bacterium]
MWQRLRFSVLIFTVLFFSVSSLYSLVIATPAETPISKISIFYKNTKQTSKEKSLLSQGDALLTDANIQISIKGLDIGSYSLLMERNGKEKTTLVEKIKIDKKTKVLIPSSNDWLTLSKKSGNYKLIISDHASGEIASEFAFMVLPASEEDDSVATSLIKNSKLTQTKFINIPKMNPNEIKNVFAYAKKTMSNIQTLRTRGVGASIYKSYAPAVAHILNIQGGETVSTGSGIILNNQGDIITNFHVAENAESYKIILKNYADQYVFEAKLESCNPSKDLALIKLKFVPPDIRTMVLGSNEDVLVGDDVHAIGHPIGQPWVYTRGTIGQIFPDYEYQIKGNKYKATMIQTQTPLNPGNSGGPLITDQGMVIGVNTFITQNAQGVNFAVSVDDIKEFYQNRFSYPCDKVRIEPKSKPVVIEEKDTNGDGKIDEVITDLNGNRKGDLMVRDTDHDGKSDRLFFDVDEDGYFETRIFEKDDMYIFLGDFDKDGKYDKIGYDYDKDFVPDKVEDYGG